MFEGLFCSYRMFRNAVLVRRTVRRILKDGLHDAQPHIGDFLRSRRCFHLLACARRKFCVLGIETSCDETGAAVVDSDKKILGEALHSQLQFHLNLGGINPPFAKCLHEQHIDRVVKNSLEQSGVMLKDLDGIAVTTKPGLKLSLLVGLNYAKELVRQSGLPLIPIHHMEAHALVARFVHSIKFPFLVLLISGGHCQIALVQNASDFLLLGTTLDNAPGEVLDKIGRKLKLKNHPKFSKVSSGEAVELAAENGDPLAIPFKPALQKNRDCNFSLSGLKSAGLTFIEDEEQKYGVEADEVIPSAADLCASLQFTLTNTLVRRLQRAMLYCERRNLIPEDNKNLVISGGVARNRYIRKSMEMLCSSMEYTLYCPPPHLCTDNGVMIAWNAIELILDGKEWIQNPDDLDVQPKCPLGKDISHEVRDASIKIKGFKLDPNLVKEELKVNVIN